MALTVLKVKNAKPGRHVDGRGLCLVVKPSGARTWVLRMQLKGHRRDYGLGSAHDVSLTDARTAAAELRRRVRDGFDPVAERRKARKVIPTFEAATRTCHETLGDGWKDGHHARWLSGFERHLFPRIGKKPVDKVDSACVVEALSPIWLEIPETARRLLQRIGVVLDFAHVIGWVPEEVSLRSVRKGLPRQNDKRGHMEAMPYADVPALMHKLAFDLLPLAERPLNLRLGAKDWLPVSALVGAIAAASSGMFGLAVSLMLAVIVLGVSGRLKGQVYHDIDWPIIILLAALIPVAQAFSESGAGETIAGVISSAGAGQPAWILVGIALGLTMAVTPFLNNAAAVLIMGPIAAQTGLETGVPVDAMLMAVAIGASCDFLTPIGHQSNTLVWGPGGYRFSDYARVGTPLTLMVLVFGTFLISSVWG